MDTTWRAILYSQFAAAIKTLENALRACPDDLWTARMWKESPQFSEVWYVIFHTLFFIDLYLDGTVEGFAPPAPFTLDELDPAGVLPERVYSKAELLSYLEHDRQKCRRRLETLTDDRAQQRCAFSWGEMSYAELLLDSMRHVQEHAAQINLFLGQQTGAASRWVAQTKEDQR
jgi:hypothetical protein